MSEYTPLSYTGLAFTRETWIVGDAFGQIHALNLAERAWLGLRASDLRPPLSFPFSPLLRIHLPVYSPSVPVIAVGNTSIDSDISFTTRILTLKEMVYTTKEGDRINLGLLAFDEPTRRWYAMQESPTTAKNRAGMAKVREWIAKERAKLGKVVPADWNQDET